MEDARLGRRRNANAGIAHDDAHAVRGGLQANVDAPAAGELQRVGEQVADDLPHARRVAEQLARQPGRDQAGQLHAWRGVLRQQAGGVFHEAAEIEGNPLQFQLPGLELGQVEDIVEQLHQNLARVVGDRQLLALLGTQRAVHRQRKHAQQAVQRCADFVTHVGKEGGACLGGLLGSALGRLQVAVGRGQAGVGRLHFSGTRRDDALEFAEVVRQAILGFAPLLDLGTGQLQLLVDRVHQHAYLVALMALGQFQAMVRVARVAAAQCARQAGQRLGQHGVEHHQQDQREQQATGEAGEDGEQRAAQELVAEGVGIDLQAQHTEVFVGVVVDEQRRLEGAPLAEQHVAEHPVAVDVAGAADAGQGDTVVVDDFRADHRGRLQEALDQLLGQLGVDVVGDARGRVVGDIQQGAHLAIDGGVFAGIIDADLDQTQQGAENECHQYRQAGLLERQAVGERYIHG